MGFFPGSKNLIIFHQILQLDLFWYFYYELCQRSFMDYLPLQEVNTDFNLLLNFFSGHIFCDSHTKNEHTYLS